MDIIHLLLLEDLMKSIALPLPVKIIREMILILSILFLSHGIGNVNAAHAAPPSNQDLCGQLLADAKARFQSTLAPDGSIPASLETQAAAQEYIRVSKLCYDQLETQTSAEALQANTPGFIDDGGVILNQGASAEFVLTGNKWGSTAEGTPGGTVTYSLMGNGISLSDEGTGKSVAISSLPTFQPCFITDIETAFAAWQAVSNIKFVQVSDNGAAFNSPSAVGDIRIGAHAFDGPYGTLAHAYFPPPNGYTAAGDLHFDSSENWTCNASGVDIGVVAMHEIGHTLGLQHENTTTVAIMDPYYNSGLSTLQKDDINGITTLYGPASLSAAPTNDDFDSATPIDTYPYEIIINATSATQANDDPATIGPCGTAVGNKTLRKGNQTVWYTYSTPATRPVSIDTYGSSYDTYVAVWTGNRGSLSLVKCDEDTLDAIQGRLTFNAIAGITYHIEVGSFGGYVNEAVVPPALNANLNFHATTFEDVTGNYWAWKYIEGLNSAGVTTGCSTNPRNYCPTATVNRDQMAVFLLKGKHTSSYVPPKATGTKFTDVPASFWAADWIEQLANENITGGCSLGKYCPGNPVTRAQMSIFLLRAKHGSSYTPPPATGMFTDVPASDPTAAWIEELANEGITGGCSVTPKKYCPANTVTRDQMAVFLDRTFNLPTLPATP